MRTPDEAIAEILSRLRPLEECDRVPLAQAFGRVLARAVSSDLDLPPFEKSAMDGYALRSADCAPGGAPVRLACVGESKAGAPWTARVAAGQCVAIYTGAELPPDCDAVVMVERTRTEDERIVIEGGATPGQHVCHRGEDLRAGAQVFQPGRRLRADDLSLLAAVGCEPVPVFRRVRVALFTTGDELVPVTSRPLPGQIREGNTYYLAAALAQAGAEVENHGVLPDDEAVLGRELGRALETRDALVTTGGVSMGRYDLVGAVLEKLGVEPVLHKIAIKPGKPLWFGLKGRVPVFALPGNPVSCLVGFEVFVRRALAKLGGAGEHEWKEERLRLGRWSGRALKENPRQQNQPVRVRHGQDGVDRLEPLAWTSSADIAGITRADGLAVVPAGRGAAEGDLLAWRALA